MTTNTLLERIRLFLPQATGATLLDSFREVDYGASFEYLKVSFADAVPKTMCLLRTSAPITEPFYSSTSFPFIDGIEEGMGLAVVGCYLLPSRALLPVGDVIDTSQKPYIDDGDWYYALYLLAS